MEVRVDQGGRLPTKGHPTDAGWDLYSPKDFVVEPHSFSERVDLAVGFGIPEGHCGYIVERSGMGRSGLACIGPVVDHGYTGNVHVTLVNNQDFPYEVSKGDRVCQMLLVQVSMEGLEQVDELVGERGNHGHGSTGK